MDTHATTRSPWQTHPICVILVFLFALSPVIASATDGHALLTSDHIRLLILGRIAERLVILGAAILSLTFGFLSLQSRGARGDLEAGAPHVFWLKLRNVGPGVFFSLFGTALLLWSLNTKLDLDLPGAAEGAPPPSAEAPAVANTQHPEVAHVSYGFGIPALADSTERRRLLSALLTAERLAAAHRPALTKAEMAQLSQAVGALEPVKVAVVDSQADYIGAYQWWQKLKHDPKYGSPDFEDQLSEKDRATLHAIEQLYSAALGAAP